MLRDGSLEYAEGDGKVSCLRRWRKQLVLGLDGFDQHELDRANEMVSAARNKPLERLSDFFRQRKV